MPKGYNKDGSKKVRPVNSGKKAVPHKSISPDITLDAAAVLAGLKKKGVNLNKFISAAIIEKAARDAEKKAAIKEEKAAAAATGQVHLVDMLEDIKLEKIAKQIQKQPVPVITPEPEEHTKAIGAFFVGQEVVRTKGDYVVGRIGIIKAIDTVKRRAQVDCGIKTWISFDSLACTSIPYKIVQGQSRWPKYQPV